MKLPYLLPVFAAAALAGCLGNNGSSVASPADVSPVVGDGIVGITWTPVLGVSYLAFGSNNPAVTTLNWTDPSIGGFPLNNVGNSSAPPALLCNDIPNRAPNGLPYYFTVNAHTGSAPGGTGSPTVTATARSAGGIWNRGTPIGVSINAVGYGAITTCTEVGLPSGIYAAVGPGGSIFSSLDGVTWVRRGPPGYTTDLYSVVVLTGSLNVPTAPNLLFVAVGAGGAVIRSADGINWATSNTENAAAPILRSVALAAGTFVAVGDGGRIQTSTDGAVWTTIASNTAVNLHSVHCVSTACVAVGDAGVIDVSVDGAATWATTTVGGGASALRTVTFGNFDNNQTVPGVNGTPGVIGENGNVFINTWVVAGDNATLYESNNVSGTTGTTVWNAAPVAGAANFAVVSYTTQFVAIDSNGNAFASQTGVANSWLPPVATGIADPVSIATNGHGYVVLGATGDNTSSF